MYGGVGLIVKKILMTATVQSHIIGFYKNIILFLKSNGWEIHIAGKGDLKGIDDKLRQNIDKIYDIPFSRSPKSLDNISAYKILKEIISENNYDIIHCNTPMGGVVTRLAAQDARKNGTKVIYTAHGFHFFKGAPLLNWLCYYPVEKMLARFTDVLITINEEDYKIADKKLKAGHIYYIPGVGIDLNRFCLCANFSDSREKNGMSDNEFAVLSVGELSERKNHEVIIRALAELNNKKLNYYIVGEGRLKGYLEDLAQSLGLENQVHLLGFRKDVDKLCRKSDLFAFPSKQEGLPVALMEAMATGLPIVCSKIRGNTDLIEDKVNGLMYSYNDVNGFATGIQKLYDDANMRRSMCDNNLEKITDFSSDVVQGMLGNIYKSVISDKRK